MPPPPQDDWSDSDDDNLSDVETSVLLGIPDGPIDLDNDVLDAAVSRIGGLPAFLPSHEPEFSSSFCKVCSNPMELLVQMWCPFEDSPMDRALYIWGCQRIGCQGKDGSVRAWRGLRYNERYAAKLEQKLARKREKEAAQLAAQAERQKKFLQSNPFSMSPNMPLTPSPFSLGGQIFGSSQPAVPAAPVTPTEEYVENSEDEDDAESKSDSGSSEASLITALASTSIEESPWKSAPSHPPLYLSTASEYLPPQPKLKLPPGAQVAEPPENDGKAGNDVTWASEAYENSLDLDQVFERFTKRVAYEGGQCVRYELDGTPLPFASDNVFDTLFPASPSEPLPVTKPDFKVVHAQKRTYTSSNIEKCPLCKSKRIFECQLMPNLINVLRSKVAEPANKMSDEDRRKAVESALKGNNSSEKRGMEWGTCMVFSCANDCCVTDSGAEAKECWTEEAVLVQWDV